eukprot:Rmarinus@m.20350
MQTKLDQNAHALDDILFDSPFQEGQSYVPGQVDFKQPRRYDEKLTKLFRSMEDRGAKAQRELDKTKKKYDDTKGRIKVVSSIKEKGRGVYSQHLKAQSVEELRSKFEALLEKKEAEFEDKLTGVMRERDELKYRVEQSENKLGKKEEELTSLWRTNELLRKKLQKMCEREMENERKIKVFTKMEPIFNQLAERFNFTSPQDVIERIESLERAQMESYTQLLEAQEQKSRVERRLEELRTQNVTAIQAQQLEHTNTINKIERRHKEIKEEFEETTLEVAKLRSKEAVYLDLRNAVIDLWRKWRERSEIARDNPSLEMLDSNDPRQLINALSFMVTCHSSADAARTLCKLAASLNGFWRRYFNEEHTLMSKPEEILNRVGEEIDEKTRSLESGKKALQKALEKQKELQAETRKAQREQRVLEQELVSWKRKFNRVVSDNTVRRSNTPLSDMFDQKRHRKHSVSSSRLGIRELDFGRPATCDPAIGRLSSSQSPSSPNRTPKRKGLSPVQPKPRPRTSMGHV